MENGGALAWTAPARHIAQRLDETATARAVYAQERIHSIEQRIDGLLAGVIGHAVENMTGTIRLGRIDGIVGRGDWRADNGLQW